MLAGVTDVTIGKRSDVAELACDTNSIHVDCQIILANNDLYNDVC